jgi:hypothetical protein
MPISFYMTSVRVLQEAESLCTVISDTDASTIYPASSAITMNSSWVLEDDQMM